MKSITQILFILLVSSLSITALKAQENTSYFLHTVEKGQSLYSISSMYNISKTEIIRLNPGSEEKIYAGQTLKIPQTISVEQQPAFHTIQPGENLYRLSVTYNVSVKDICDENPGLSVETFKAGQVIRIPSAATSTTVPVPTVENTEIPQVQPEVKPRCKEMHKVKRKETIFSVSREYKITEQELIEANPELKEGMKKGQLLCIPYPKTSTVVVPAKNPDFIIPPSNRDLFRENKEAVHSINTIKAALILPFLTHDGRKSDAARMIEYYEGFLLAVDSLKRKGTSIDLYVYDSGGENASVTPILAKEELKNMDIIFGPLYKQHIHPLATFADEHDIRLVIPILKDDEVFQNSHIYQVNTTQSYLYSEVYEHFTRQFPNANVIILDMHTEDKDKSEFIQGLKMELSRKGIPMQIVNGVNLSQAAINSALRSDKDNVFIPTSGNAITLNKIMPQLKILVKENPTTNISLFGYPEWQTHINDNLESFFELNTYFYSSFYTSNLLPAAKAFNQSYRRWYSKEMLPNYPKYGMLGFDTGLFFLTGLEKYGTGLEQNLSSIDLTPVQTGFKFERVNNWGGFINKKVFFIHFTKDFELIKLDFE
ncbi:LysM peptidoglycan-binding domain-containing protein [Bacteroides sp. 51]|uniref:PBP1 and LysM peptidoglycan-binding domain-containing protein n=1 Tax=Bacteroides sp. 51 TaxID=2302938 RepID=UPI0013D1492C|nr:LysM peptidoglycan-binding domain-containing protein [Bacteroides sp. 51]NDV83708.1 LysM peptidoglycan-binding domain-containing protein [Bacteroides sp. 51]